MQEGAEHMELVNYFKGVRGQEYGLFPVPTKKISGGILPLNKAHNSQLIYVHACCWGIARIQHFLKLCHTNRIPCFGTIVCHHCSVLETGH